ncbi:MAG: sulfurtransferase [Dokdonella sp.]
MNTNPLISAAELAAIIDRDDVIVVDCRHQLADPAAGNRAWKEGHIPGGVHANLDHDLSDLGKQGEGRHPLPDPASFMRWLASIGWTPEKKVVTYDDAGGALAASRLWWMLRLIGHDKAQVLDGGLAAWTRNGSKLENSLWNIVASEPRERAWSSVQLVDAQSLQRGLADRSMLLIDARAEARYRGEVEPIDSVAGHVPGAVNRPFSANLDDNGLFKRSSPLRDEWLALLEDRRPDDVVHMCGSGVTACHNLLAMEHAGLHGARLYVPSWSGWISDPGRPVAKGEMPNGE